MVVPFALTLVLQGKNLRPIAERNAMAFRTAILHRDAKWFDRTFSASFVQRNDEVRLDRKTALAQIRSGLLHLNVKALTATVKAVKPDGTGYVATILWRGRMAATLQDRPANLNVSWQDIQRWAPQGATWRLRSLATSKFERTIE